MAEDGGHGEEEELTRSTSMAKKDTNNECCAASSVAVKGHFVVYTADRARFEVPQRYLGTAVVGELVRMSRDEFGFASGGRIMLPCDEPVMEYVLCLFGRNLSEEEMDPLSSVVRPCNFDTCLEASIGLSHKVISCY